MIMRIGNIEQEKSIVYDADVIIHFISGDRLLDLFKILPNANLILDKVYEELSKNYRTKNTIDNLIDIKLVKIVTFSSNLTIIKEYAHLTSKLMNKGRGESACMAYCVHTKDVIASSNLKDIGSYCRLHAIPYLTTMDFVCCAYETGMWDLGECNDFVKKLISKNHNIPCSSFDEFANDNGISLAG